MLRLLIRIVALALTAALVVDPSCAYAFSGTVVYSLPQRSIFQTQALAGVPISGHKILSVQALLGAIALSLGVVSCSQPAETPAKIPPAPKSVIAIAPPTPAPEATPVPNIRFEGPGKLEVVSPFPGGSVRPPSLRVRFDPSLELFDIEIPLRGIKDLSRFIGLQVYLKEKTPEPGVLAIWFRKERGDQLFETEPGLFDLKANSEFLQYSFYPTKPELKPRQSPESTDWRTVANSDMLLEFQTGEGDRLRIDHVELVPNEGSLSKQSPNLPTAPAAIPSDKARHIPFGINSPQNRPMNRNPLMGRAVPGGERSGRIHTLKTTPRGPLPAETVRGMGDSQNGTRQPPPGKDQAYLDAMAQYEHANARLGEAKKLLNEREPQEALTILEELDDVYAHVHAVLFLRYNIETPELFQVEELRIIAKQNAALAQLSTTASPLAPMTLQKKYTSLLRRFLNNPETNDLHAAQLVEDYHRRAQGSVDQVANSLIALRNAFDVLAMSPSEASSMMSKSQKGAIIKLPLSELDFRNLIDSGRERNLITLGFGSDRYLVVIPGSGFGDIDDQAGDAPSQLQNLPLVIIHGHSHPRGWGVDPSEEDEDAIKAHGRAEAQLRIPEFIVGLTTGKNLELNVGTTGEGYREVLQHNAAVRKLVEFQIIAAPSGAPRIDPAQGDPDKSRYHPTSIGSPQNHFGQAVPGTERSGYRHSPGRLPAWQRAPRGSPDRDRENKSFALAHRHRWDELSQYDAWILKRYYEDQAPSKTIGRELEGKPQAAGTMLARALTRLDLLVRGELPMGFRLARKYSDRLDKLLPPTDAAGIRAFYLLGESMSELADRGIYDSTLARAIRVLEQASAGEKSPRQKIMEHPDALNNLSAAYRELLIAIDLEGESQVTFARRKGISKSNVSQTLDRARQALQEAIKTRSLSDAVLVERHTDSWKNFPEPLRYAIETLFIQGVLQREAAKERGVKQSTISAWKIQALRMLRRLEARDKAAAFWLVLFPTAALLGLGTAWALSSSIAPAAGRELSASFEGWIGIGLLSGLFGPTRTILYRKIQTAA